MVATKKLEIGKFNGIYVLKLHLIIETSFWSYSIYKVEVLTLK